MAEIVHDTTHVAEGLAFLTGDNAQANIKAILTAWLSEIQTLEDAIYAVYQSRIIDNAVGAQLDLLGTLVGEPRDNRTDTAYRVGIRVRIIVNFSDGTPNDITKILATGAPDATSVYEDTGPGHFQVTISNVKVDDDVPSLTAAVNEARATATNGDLIYSSSGTAALIWCAVADQGTTPYLWDDVADSLVKGKWCATNGV